MLNRRKAIRLFPGNDRICHSERSKIDNGNGLVFQKEVSGFNGQANQMFKGWNFLAASDWH